MTTKRKKKVVKQENFISKNIVVLLSGLAIFLIVLNLAVIFISNNKKDVFEVAEKKTEKEREEIIVSSENDLVKLPPPVNESVDNLEESSFGDSFSSGAWLNEQATTMFLDDQAGALIFPPKYSFYKMRDCDVSANDCRIFKTDENNACIKGACLQLRSGSLFVNNRKISSPRELSGKSVKRIYIYALENNWLVGAILNTDDQEEVVVFRFDGQNFSKLIGAGQGFNNKTQFGRGGGNLSFGGTENDFLVVYSGYEGLAFHFRNWVGTDISSLFGLRVTAGGFSPQIVRISDSRGVFWYIAGQAAEEIKFLKLWQNGTNNIIGLTDLSKVFPMKKLNPESLLILPDNSSVERALKFIINEGTGKMSLWRFIDLGFDNSQDRLVVSRNLNEQGWLVLGAMIKDLGISSAGNNKGIIQISNNSADWLGAEVGERINFPDQKGRSLFWRSRFVVGDDQDYSPFFAHLNDFRYFFQR